MPSEKFSADPFSRSYQEIPEDLFALVRASLIDHEQFFILAVFHKIMDYEKDGSVRYSLEILAERTALSRRTLVRRIGSLVKNGFLIRRRSDIMNEQGYCVNEYIVNWPRIHTLGGILRGIGRKKKRTAPKSGRRPQWRVCPTCGTSVSPYEVGWNSFLAAPEKKPIKPIPLPAPESPEPVSVVADDLSF